jgi:phosphatidate phosphatase APP1
MASYSFLSIILLLFVINVDSRRLSQELRIRQLWQLISDKFKDTTVNKFHVDIRHFDKEEMLLFPDVAYQSLNNDSTWKIMVHGWRYEGNKGKNWFGLSASRWVERLAKHLMSPDAILYLNGSLNRDRLKPFFVDDESNELIAINIGEKTHLLRTDKNGQFYDQIELTNDEVQKLKQHQPSGDIITYEAIGDNKDKSTGVIRLIDQRQGISIISDIDDTIKISEVLDKVRLLANTFIHPFKPVPGKYDK